MNEITCYMCKGDKFIVVQDKKTKKQSKMTCPVCNGKGKIETNKDVR